MIAGADRRALLVRSSAPGAHTTAADAIEMWPNWMVKTHGHESNLLDQMVSQARSSTPKASLSEDL